MPEHLLFNAHAATAHTVHYERWRPEQTLLHRLVREHLATFLAQVEARTGTYLPGFVKDEFEAFLECGILAHGFLRVRCAECAHEKLVAFSRKRARRMAESGSSALVPRLHLIRFHGVLAPNAGLRAAVVPGPAHKHGEHAQEHAHPSARIAWARLLKRVFDLDLEHCPQCGGEFRIIAAIEAPDGIKLAEGNHLTPIPLDEAVASLSAILLEEEYRAFIMAGRRESDGLPWVGEARLIRLNILP